MRKYEKNVFAVTPVRDIRSKFLLFKSAPEQMSVWRSWLVGSPTKENKGSACSGAIVPDAKSNDYHMQLK